MTLAQALSLYIGLNLLIVIGFVGTELTMRLLGRDLRVSGARQLLRLQYLTLGTVLVLSFLQPVLHTLLPTEDFFTPPMHVWSASSMKSFAEEFNAQRNQGVFRIPTGFASRTIRTDQVATIAQFIFGFVIVGALLFLWRDLMILRKLRRGAFLIRKVGRVSIFASDEVCVPFSFWVPGQAVVLVSQAMLASRDLFQIAVKHEIQHHRQGDTRWIYAFLILRAVCFVNPAIHLWSRRISELQEWACDEALVDQRKVEPQVYARCLLEVAESAHGRKLSPACASGLTFLTGHQQLKRRIARMITRSPNRYFKNRQFQRAAFAMALAVVTTMGLTAVAAKGLVQDRRVTLAAAQNMVAKAQGLSPDGFPVALNELVLKQLNRFIGTPEGREFMRNALVRMESYRGLVEPILKKYDMPEEIMAVPLVESGYQNLPERQNAQWPGWRAAGLWQFIASTARNFGLQVDSVKDERLDVALETDAAMRLILANKLRFKDWSLSMMAYNMGEVALQKGIAQVGVRDPWSLIRSGVEGDKDYLAKVHAAILIMRNPESVK